MAKLALVRHGESLWNATGQWTGWTDIDLSSKGIQQALDAARALWHIKFDFCFTSDLVRAVHTAHIILEKLQQYPQLIQAGELKERNYGVYTAKNKWEIQKELGDEKFQKLRRSFNFPIQDGESLKQVYERVTPYYQKEIYPKLAAGKNVLICAHGNSLRALVKYLNHLSDDQVEYLEIETGEALLFDI